MLTDVNGVRVGHWTDTEARTGCTVVVLPPGTVGSGEVRGGAPASREFALLEPTRTVAQIDAVVLSGGSAFGLASADGVVSGLESAGRGFPTDYGPVPIVVGMSLFDLAVGDARVRPGTEQGRFAFEQAMSDEGLAPAAGLVGAGTGATVAKWWGKPRPGGLGVATERVGSLTVSAMIAVNAVGGIDDGTTVADPGDLQPPFEADDVPVDDAPAGEPAGSLEGRNTTIGVIVTNAVVDKIGCNLLAQGGHDGFARAIYPSHTAADGDALVALATGEVELSDVEVSPFRLRALAQNAVTRAIRSLAH